MEREKRIETNNFDPNNIFNLDSQDLLNIIDNIVLKKSKEVGQRNGIKYWRKISFTDSPKVMIPSSYTIKLGKEHTCSTTKYTFAVIKPKKVTRISLTKIGSWCKHFQGRYLFENGKDESSKKTTFYHILPQKCQLDNSNLKLIVKLQ